MQRNLKVDSNKVETKSAFNVETTLHVDES